MTFIKLLFVALSFIIITEVLVLSSILYRIVSHGKSTGTIGTVEAKPTETQPNNTKIVFVSDRNGGNDIYLMDLTTKETINLTQSPGDDMNPQVSTDGKLLVFYSDRDGDNEIFQLNLETQELTQLTDNSVDDYDPSYSHSVGTKYILFKSTRDDKLGDVFIMKTDGSEQHNLTASHNKTEEWDPTFTHDGKKIIYVVRDDNDHLKDELYSMNIDGSNIEQITNNDVPDWYPSVNPKDGKLAFVSRINKISQDDIYLSLTNGSKRLKVTSLIGNNDDPSWDYNGEKVIFINDNDGDYDMYITTIDGSEIVRIEDTDSNELSPIFLPTK